MDCGFEYMPQCRFLGMAAEAEETRMKMRKRKTKRKRRRGRGRGRGGVVRPSQAEQSETRSEESKCAGRQGPGPRPGEAEQKQSNWTTGQLDKWTEKPAAASRDAICLKREAGLALWLSERGLYLWRACGFRPTRRRQSRVCP